jgi:hypothetical protein
MTKFPCVVLKVLPSVSGQDGTITTDGEALGDVVAELAEDGTAVVGAALEFELDEGVGDGLAEELGDGPAEELGDGLAEELGEALADGLKVDKGVGEGLEVDDGAGDGVELDEGVED